VPSGLSRLESRKIVLVRFLKEAPRPPLEIGIVVFDGEQAMRRRAVAVKRRAVDVPAMRTRALITGHGPFDHQRSAALAGTKMVRIGNLVEIAARRAHHDIGCVPGVLGQYIARKEVEAFPSCRARPGLHPQEILNVGILSAGNGAARLVELADFVRKVIEQLTRLLPVSLEVDGIDLFVHDPRRHRIDIRPDDVAADPVGFEQWGSATHERIGNCHALEAVGTVICLLDRLAAEFREKQPAEQRSRPTRKPFVYGNDRAVILLNLLFTQRQ